MVRSLQQVPHQIRQLNYSLVSNENGDKDDEGLEG